MTHKTYTVDCCIAGGGPAGMMLGFLLARAGLHVVVLEKHADFLRDFRGDTVHPSTLEIMHELGLLEEFLRCPHQKVSKLTTIVGNTKVTVADFSHLNVEAPYIAFMPQWDFLNFLAKHAKPYPGFNLLMQAEVTDLIEDQGIVVGAKAKTPEGEIYINSKLVVGADGRHSTVRSQAGLQVKEFGIPIDVLWFRISRHQDDPTESMGRFMPGKIQIMLNRGDYWQCGYVIPKGEFETLKQQGLHNFLDKILEVAPFLNDRTRELKEWDQIKLLTVQVDRLEKWHRPGLLCIGDAAHAMSPVAGVGINLAIQDAVATANLLEAPLRSGKVTEKDLRAVQKRRSLPVQLTQRLQLFLHKRIIFRVISKEKPFSLPWPLRLLNKYPLLQRIPAYLIGIGFRPEHI